MRGALVIIRPRGEEEARVNDARRVALLLSAVMMLKHLGERSAALRIENAIDKVYTEAKHTTRDVGGKSGTADFTDAVISALAPVPTR